MADSDFKPTAVLGGYLRETDPDGAVKLARELCSQLEGDPDSFHGGVWPGNVDLDVDGKAVLGGPNRTAAAQRPADQVEYTAPEFFWNGETSAAADVYAVGLMLYAGCSGGYLPFQPRTGELTDQDRANALRRRMKGEAIPAPENVSDELKKVIEKALAYDPEARYITAKELLTALGRTDEALPGAAAAAAAAVSVPAEPPVPLEEEPEAPAAAEEVPPAPAEEPAVEEDIPAPAEEPVPAAEPETPVPEEEASPAPEEEVSVPEAEAETKEAPAPAEETPQEPAEEEIPAAAAAAAAGAAVGAAAVGTKRASGAAPRQYRVQKDFDSGRQARRSRTAAPASHRRKKKSPVLPVLCGLAAAAILGSVGYALMGGLHGTPVESETFTPLVTPEGESAEQAASPSAEPTAKPSARPSATPRPSASPRPSADPSATPSAGSPAGTGTATAAGPGTAIGTGAGSGTGPSTGSGSGPTGGGNTSAGGGYTGGSGTGSGSSGGYTGSTGSGSSGGYTGSTGSGSGTSAGGFTVEPAGGTVYLTGDQVRVRSGPGTGYRVLGYTHKGDSLTRTGTVSNGWTQVNYGGGSGFVYSSYLSATDPSAPSASPTPSASPSPAPTYKVETEALKYDAAKDKGLATVASQEEFDAVTAALKDSALSYAWVGVEKAEDGTWKSGGTAVPDNLWKSGEPRQDNDWALLEKQADGTWKLITVKSEGFDATAEPYTGKLGYVTQTAASP